MKNVDAATDLHIRARRGVQPRNFVWVEARNRQTGGIETMGLSSLDDTITVTVIDGRTRLPVQRIYHGIGGNLKVPPIPLTTDLSIRNIRIGLSQISPAVQQLVRGYETRRAPIEVHRGYFDPATSLLIAPPLPRFVGWINGNPIKTPSANAEGGIEVACVSHSRKLTFTNPAKRSDEQQRRRQGDRFRRYTDVAGTWLAQISWGEEGANATGVTGFLLGRGPSGGMT